MDTRLVRLAFSGLFIVTTACSGVSSGRGASMPAQGGAYSAGGALLPAVRLASRRKSDSPFGPIQHVVIIMQENRSFDNLFAGYPGADAPMSGVMHDGTVVPLKPIGFETTDVDHSYGASIQDYDGGKMDGFDLNYTGRGRQAGRFAYSYLARHLVAPYWIMAQQYTLADAMFATEHGASWTAHLDIIAGTTNIAPHQALVDFPSQPPYDCDAAPGTKSSLISPSRYSNHGPYPCFTQFATMADTLDAAGISWRFYAARVTRGSTGIGGIWSSFGAIHNVRYGKDWAKVINPPSRILTDIAAGKLANVAWVTPEWQYSDHAGGGATQGPSWVAAVVNAIGESQYWNSTAIVVLWDDWGGFYDDAVPPQLDFKGLGLRVGCLIISPYAIPGHVSHTQYEFGSVLKFVEQTFNLPALGTTAAGYSDTRANSIADSFDFSQSPIIFQPIPAPYSGPFFIHEKPSGKAPDDE
jgi:phospholipase C